MVDICACETFIYGQFDNGLARRSVLFMLSPFFVRRKSTGGYAINLQNDDSEFTKRYILAHELSHYIMNQAPNQPAEKKKAYGQNCIDPLFAKNRDELMADIMSAFLLFPPEKVLESLKKYTEYMKKMD